MVIGNHILINGDCLEVMPSIESGSVDMILCDLPYGTTACKWDVIIPFDKLWKEYERIIKPNGAIVLTASQPFTSALVMSNPKLFKYSWTWYKSKTSGHLNAKKQPLRVTEDVLVFYKKQSTYNPILRQREKKNIRTTQATYQNSGNQTYGKVKEFRGYNEGRVIDVDKGYPVDLIGITTVGNFGTVRLHPTQKPVALFEYLIKTYTNEGETVLDNCAGSFTTAVACENTGRKSICIEREEKYFNIGVERVGNIQPSLFKKTG